MDEHEPNTIKGIVSRYERLRPKTVTKRFTTGPEESNAIGELWDREVERTKLAFRFTNWALQHCLDIRTSMILVHDSQGNTLHNDGSSDGPKVSDNQLTELIFNDDAQTLVSMINRRDMFNHQAIHIARYPLQGGSIQSLEMLVEFDNEYRQEHPEVSL
jgi:hypothetical protein